jgi:penicillin-binding protein 1B
LQEVVSEGTARAAYNALPRSLNLAGKTGTSNDLKDSWFAGFSGDYLSVVWVGRDDNKSAGLSGANGALPIWIALMKEIAHKAVDLVVPENVQQVWIDPSNGLLTESNCAGARQYPYIIGSEPVNSSPCASEPSLDELPSLDGEPNPDENMPDNNAEPAAPEDEPAEPTNPTINNPKTWFNNFF